RSANTLAAASKPGRGEWNHESTAMSSASARAAPVTALMLRRTLPTRSPSGRGLGPELLGHRRSWDLDGRRSCLQQCHLQPEHGRTGSPGLRHGRRLDRAEPGLLDQLVDTGPRVLAAERDPDALAVAELDLRPVGQNHLDRGTTAVDVVG